MHDRWKHFRKNLFRSVEPKIELVLMSEPQGRFKKLLTTETAPGYTARKSHESEGSPEDDIRLNKFLIKKAHKTPLEAVTFTFHVYGITKSLQNQWVRHRIGVGWTYRSTRNISADQNEFVYCTYNYIDDESRVMALLREDEESAKEAIARFKRKRELGATKQDSRKIMPVFWNTPCYFYCNASSLRYLFSLRLEKDAEWEIRRMSRIMWEIVIKETPSLFEDFENLARRED